VTAISGGTVGAAFATLLGGTLLINADGSYVYTAPDNVDGLEQEVFTYTLTDSDGSTDTATLTIDIEDVVSTSTALLITNSNVDTLQYVEIVVSSEHGSNTTGVVEATEVQGQEISALEFIDPVVFNEGETYTITIEHVDGDPIILTDLSITDVDGHVFDIYEGNAKLETGDVGQTTNPDGYIFNLTIDGADHTVYTVSEAIGYEVDANQVLTLDTETNTSNFILDFSELSLNGGQDLFGDVETIDISGKGTQEDNTIYISAQDVLDLGTSGDSTITITGDAGDAVNLVDLDNGGAGTWSETATGGGTTTYTYNNGIVDIATVTVDDILNTTQNTTTFDGI